MSARGTPVMLQHAAAKRAYPDAVVFFRLGDFYEMFEDDAVLCARLLDLALTSRNKGKPDEIPMAGVPHHAAHGHIARLLQLGHKVAICEQLADPATVKGIVPRAVVRVLTPGTVTAEEHLELRENSWLGALEVRGRGVGLALLDVSTAELRAALLPDMATALVELARLSPREVVVGAAPAEQSALSAALAAALPRLPHRVEAPLDAAAAAEVLGAVAGDARGLPDLARAAAAQAVRYARGCHPGGALPLRRIVEHRAHGGLLLDPAARAHLEIVESPGGREATLLAVIDRTQTAFGARLLRRRLLAPLTDVARIRRRLDVVELFVGESALREALRGELSRVTDLERLGVRVERGEASPRDLGALRDGLAAAARAVSLVLAAPGGALGEVLGLAAGGPDTVPEIRDLLTAALVERPPTALKEGGVFLRGFDRELDEADALVRGGGERMTALEAELRARTGIGTLKVRYTRVFGWYVEVSRAQAARVPEGFRRKQTVATGERYTLPEVEDLADRIAHAEDRRRERELALFGELATAVARAGERIAELAAVLARWDVSAALADLAHRADYRRPAVDDSDHLELTDARHPVVERLAAEGRFVPNDVALSAGGERLWIVTGPNMAGKSTLLRQVALAVVLAQMGSFVPARAARIGVVDRVLSRVGASDNLARGESTFMVEMRETAAILRGATARSLVILDEIGRGTSTFDGLAIAWAVAEYLDEAARCRTLFATHYHELTALAEGSPHVANVSVSAEESGDDIVFLHRLERRAASRSYGVAVARLAGLPESVLARARAVLAELEAGGAPGGGANADRAGRPRGATAQLELFAPPPSGPESEVLATVRALEPERMTPLDALSLLTRLAARLRDGG